MNLLNLSYNICIKVVKRYAVYTMDTFKKIYYVLEGYLRIIYKLRGEKCPKPLAETNLVLSLVCFANIVIIYLFNSTQFPSSSND